MNEFDRGHLVGYREGQNDVLRGGLNEEKPSFLRGPARGIFVLWLVVFSLFGSWDLYRHKLATHRAIQIAESILDHVRYVVTMQALMMENEVRDIRADLDRRMNGE